MKLLSTAVLIASVGFCTPKCDESNLVNALVFPENMEDYIPYKDHDKFTLVHNSGTEIQFEVYRNSTVETDHCDHCCDYYTYENEQLFFTSDYPFYDIQSSITAITENEFEYRISIGEEYFALNEQAPLADSVKINNRYFYDVLKLKSYNYTDDSKREIDSLYFNYPSGILKIIEQNGDVYEIQ